MWLALRPAAPTLWFITVYYQLAYSFAHNYSRCLYALYDVDAVVPPLPVQLVWKNSPLGLSMRS